MHVIKSGESISSLKEPRMALKRFLFLSLRVKEGNTVISSGSPHQLCLPVRDKWYVASDILMKENILSTYYLSGEG